jgi:hypothetical protein
MTLSTSRLALRFLLLVLAVVQVGRAEDPERRIHRPTQIFGIHFSIVFVVSILISLCAG